MFGLCRNQCHIIYIYIYILQPQQRETIPSRPIADWWFLTIFICFSRDIVEITLANELIFVSSFYSSGRGLWRIYKICIDFWSYLRSALHSMKTILLHRIWRQFGAHCMHRVTTDQRRSKRLVLFNKNNIYLIVSSLPKASWIFITDHHRRPQSFHYFNISLARGW
jgi:hypothetical protein